MSAEWVTALATAGTFLVIAASAFAALLQLRHMRGSNQIVALTECRETLESPEFREAQRFASYELPKRLRDPDARLNIAQLPFSGEYESIGTVANFFESMGTFVKTGIIDAGLACDLWAYVVVRNWNALLPVITYVREDLGTPSLWENFEYLAWMSSEYMKRHPTGTYPAHAGHMPPDRSFIEAVGATRSEH